VTSVETTNLVLPERIFSLGHDTCLFFTEVCRHVEDTNTCNIRIIRFFLTHLLFIREDPKHHVCKVSVSKKNSLISCRQSKPSSHANIEHHALTMVARFRGGVVTAPGYLGVTMCVSPFGPKYVYQGQTNKKGRIGWCSIKKQGTNRGRLVSERV
jgi:hypothetical protein